jgi:hypothetical protein
MKGKGNNMATKKTDVTAFEHLLQKGYSADEAEEYAGMDEGDIPGPKGSERAAVVTDPPPTWGTDQFELGYGPAVDQANDKGTDGEEVTTQDTPQSKVKEAPTVPGVDQAEGASTASTAQTAQAKEEASAPATKSSTKAAK